MDVDLAFDAAASNFASEYFDRNNSGTVDATDALFLIQTILGTDYGDANLDGVVDGADFNRWNDDKFQSCGTSWSQGDFNGDRTTDGTDFNLWFDRRFSGTPVAAPTVTMARMPRAAIAIRGAAYVDEVLRGLSRHGSEGRDCPRREPSTVAESPVHTAIATMPNSHLRRQRPSTTRGGEEQGEADHDDQRIHHQIIDGLFGAGERGP